MKPWLEEHKDKGVKDAMVEVVSGALSFFLFLIPALSFPRSVHSGEKHLKIPTGVRKSKHESQRPRRANLKP